MSTPMTAQTALRYMVGKTIASVDVQKCRTNYGRTAHHVEKIVFTDGTFLILNVVELEDAYAVEMTRYKAKA